MDSQKVREILVFVTVFIEFLILVTIPVRNKFILKHAGNCIYSVKKRSVLLQIMIVVSCVLLMAVLYFRELGTICDFVVCLVAILGVSMSSEEVALSSKCGIYENGIIGGGHFLPLKEIYAVKGLNDEDSDQGKSEYSDSSSLQIVTDKKGLVTFLYSDEEERNLVLEKLVSLIPALKA